MADSLLLDTGPLVALLDRAQSTHEECHEHFRAWTGAVLTTEAVLTEASHLLGRVRGGGTACLAFIHQGGALVSPFRRARLERALELMRRYADVPMDYADATLVALAEEVKTDRVFTLDQRGFAAYRWDRRRPFHIVP